MKLVKASLGLRKIYRKLFSPLWRFCEARAYLFRSYQRSSKLLFTTVEVL